MNYLFTTSTGLLVSCKFKGKLPRSYLALNFDTSKTHSLGSLVYLSSGSGDILFHFAMRKIELIDVFMQRIGESCPQIKSCIIRVDNTTDVQRVQAYWTNLKESSVWWRNGVNQVLNVIIWTI